MMQGPAVELGIQLSILAESDSAAAALVVPSSPVGDHTDLEAVRAFAASCDVVTFDHEHVPQDILQALEDDGVAVHPSRAALHFAQDKLAMRERLERLGIACPRLDPGHDCGRGHGLRRHRRLARRRQDPARRLRRQGRERRVLGRRARRLAGALGEPGPVEGGLLLEEKVDFVREIAVLIARSPSGQAAAWPVVETVQTDGICTEVLAPAPGLDPDLASVVTEAALRIAGELDVTGVLAVEMFEVRAGEQRSAGGEGRPAAGRHTSSTSWRCARTTAGTGRWTAR